ncbi:AraC family transcriptional regulator [uncultured Ferrimonas sp.]|uniref:AraC family transcriptional regulator n=1 Tax=uncultured Ferrimonas sp. TaxID=432640 RepID=UPI00262FF25A|nr:AraC family transcriptional regulator [uncultured Ferrimonas sp.]
MQTLPDTLTALWQQHGQDQANGHAESYHSCISLFRREQEHHMTPVMYQQGVVLLGQGHKAAMIGEHQFRYDANDVLIIATSSPLECHAYASEDQPLLGLYLPLCAQTLRPIMEQLVHQRGADYFQPYYGIGVDRQPRDQRLQHAIDGLATSLLDPVDAKILAPNWINSIYYLLLTGPKRHLVAALTQQDQHLARISASVEHIQAHCEQKLTVEQLASIAGMSESAFYRAFKSAMKDSPLQYLKKIRLNQAKNLILHQGYAANVAAFAVGYESAPQFSREFKRYFGVPPSQAAQIGLMQSA